MPWHGRDSLETLSEFLTTSIECADKFSEWVNMVTPISIAMARMNPLLRKRFWKALATQRRLMADKVFEDEYDFTHSLKDDSTD